MVEKMLQVREIAELLALHPHTVRGYIRSGLLPAAKFGTRWRVSQEDLKRFIEERKRPKVP